MQDINLKQAFSNKSVIVDVLIAFVVIFAILYGVFNMINNSASNKNFLTGQNVFDEIKSLKTAGVDFSDIDNKVREVFSNKENTHKEVIFQGTNGRVNPFSVR